MPLVRIQTNVALECSDADALANSATAIVARELGKPESITMAAVEAGAVMTFGGTGEPTALFEIEGIDMSAEPADFLCQALTDLAESSLGVEAARVFVKLTNVPRGYWAGDRKVY
jgi:phenylpyruvate tautomerase PptA (4-oxalocrotonate tautomerase family)